MGITFTGRVLRFASGLALIALLAPADLLAREATTITAVEVQEADGSTRIVLRGAEDAIYTAFMREDPPRLIIELPNLSFDGVDAPIHVGNGLVNDVTLGTFGDAQLGHSMARVSIGLARESEYEVVPQGNEIVVELKPAGNGTRIASVDAVPAAPADVPVEESKVGEPLQKKTVVAPEVVTPENGEFESMPAAQDPAAKDMAEEAAVRVPGSKIVKITARAEGLMIASQGPIDNVDSFMLSDPDRLVIDFWGAKSAVWPDRIQYPEGAVSRVRVGEHADKVRVVLDLRMPLIGHEVVPSDAGVMVKLDPDTTQAAESTQASPVPAAPSDDEDMDAPTASQMGEPLKVGEPMSADTVERNQVAPKAQPEPMAQAQPEPMPAAAPAPELADAAPQPETPATDEAMDDAPSNDTAMDDAATASSDESTSDGAADAWHPTPTGEPLVESVHFESLPGVDRVVVTMSGDASATMVEPDPATLIVMLPGARITKENERRVDTSEFGGAVKMFSVFQTPDVDHDEVRVVLHRKDDEPAKLTWEGSQLRIEMERDETAQVAPTPDPMPTQTASAQPAPQAEAKAAPAAPAPAPAQPADFDPFLDGPANPAAIDILEEGGFDEEKSYEGRRISLDFKDADIANILRLIAEVSDLNVIAGEEVAGRVTIRLVDVPWDQALDVILLTKGLGFVRIGNILRIAPVETLKLEREARLQERRAREKLEDLVVKLQPVNYAKADDVSKLVKRLLSARGSVNVDKRTNTLIIKDIPSVIHEATALVKAVDTQTPQVMIETKIVEANLNFSRGLGAIWGTGYNPNGSLGGGQDLHLANTNASLIPGLATQSTNFISSNPIAAATGLLTLGVLSLDDHLQLDLQLAAAEENRKGKVISSPRVVTLDNKEATIKQGVAIKFVETTSEKITVSFIDAVLQLKVTPHITANRSIIMKVKVSRNAPSLSAADGTIVGIEKNETQTEAIVRDGETMVLGGIYVVENGRSRTKVPFLADIPLLGTAFRSFQVQDERRELLVFVTPRVIQGPGADL